MATVNVSFKSQEIQNFYEGKDSASVEESLTEFRTGANIADAPQGDFADVASAKAAAQKPIRASHTQIIRTPPTSICTPRADTSSWTLPA